MISVTLVFNDHFVLFKGGTEEEEAQMSLSMLEICRVRLVFPPPVSIYG